MSGPPRRSWTSRVFGRGGRKGIGGGYGNGTDEKTWENDETADTNSRAAQELTAAAKREAEQGPLSLTDYRWRFERLTPSRELAPQVQMTLMTEMRGQLVNEALDVLPLPDHIKCYKQSVSHLMYSPDGLSIRYCEWVVQWATACHHVGLRRRGKRPVTYHERLWIIWPGAQIAVNCVWGEVVLHTVNLARRLVFQSAQAEAARAGESLESKLTLQQRVSMLRVLQKVIGLLKFVREQVPVDYWLDLPWGHVGWPHTRTPCLDVMQEKEALRQEEEDAQLTRGRGGARKYKGGKARDLGSPQGWLAVLYALLKAYTAWNMASINAMQALPVSLPRDAHGPVDGVELHTKAEAASRLYFTCFLTLRSLPRSIPLAWGRHLPRERPLVDHPLDNLGHTPLVYDSRDGGSSMASRNQRAYQSTRTFTWTQTAKTQWMLWRARWHSCLGESSHALAYVRAAVRNAAYAPDLMEREQAQVMVERAVVPDSIFPLVQGIHPVEGTDRGDDPLQGRTVDQWLDHFAFVQAE